MTRHNVLEDNYISLEVLNEGVGARAECALAEGNASLADRQYNSMILRELLDGREDAALNVAKRAGMVPEEAGLQELYKLPVAQRLDRELRGGI